MKKETKTKICPACKQSYSGYPALSRKDNKTKICNNCGIEEALTAYFKTVSKKP